MADAGYRGRIRSLGGIEGADGKGLAVAQTALTVVPSDTQPLCTVNGLRKWLLVQCVTDVGAYVWLDEKPTYQLQLNRYDTFVIDEDLPWTGTISAASRDAALNSTLVILEASVQT